MEEEYGRNGIILPRALADAYSGRTSRTEATAIEATDDDFMVARQAHFVREAGRFWCAHRRAIAGRTLISRAGKGWLGRLA